MKSKEEVDVVRVHEHCRSEVIACHNMFIDG
jgi:hypothetical protein